jgi:DNA-directed RNA polymerase subunit RPC12/RpoP
MDMHEINTKCPKCQSRIFKIDLNSLHTVTSIENIDGKLVIAAKQIPAHATGFVYCVTCGEKLFNYVQDGPINLVWVL